MGRLRIQLFRHERRDGDLGVTGLPDHPILRVGGWGARPLFPAQLGLWNTVRRHRGLARPSYAASRSRARDHHQSHLFFGLDRGGVGPALVDHGVHRNFRQSSCHVPNGAAQLRVRHRWRAAHRRRPWAAEPRHARGTAGRRFDYGCTHAQAWGHGRHSGVAHWRTCWHSPRIGGWVPPASPRQSNVSESGKTCASTGRAAQQSKSC